MLAWIFEPHTLSLTRSSSQYTRYPYYTPPPDDCGLSAVVFVCRVIVNEWGGAPYIAQLFSRWSTQGSSSSSLFSRWSTQGSSSSSESLVRVPAKAPEADEPLALGPRPARCA